MTPYTDKESREGASPWEFSGGDTHTVHASISGRLGCEWTSLLFLQSRVYYWPEHEELGQNETGWGSEGGRWGRERERERG